VNRVVETLRKKKAIKKERNLGHQGGKKKNPPRIGLGDDKERGPEKGK